MGETYKLTNPSLGGVAAQDISYKIPSEEELFWMQADKGKSLNLRKNNQIYEINPSSLLSTYNEGGKAEAAEAEIRKFFEGVTMSAGNSIDRIISGMYRDERLIDPKKYDQPDWQGKTAGQWLSEAGSKTLNELGIDPSTIATGSTSTGTTYSLSQAYRDNILTKAGKLSSEDFKKTYGEGSTASAIQGETAEQTQWKQTHSADMYPELYSEKTYDDAQQALQYAELTSQSGDLKSNVDSTDPNLIANKDYVNAAFKAYHGRDANETELNEFTNKKTGDVLNAIKAGVPGQESAVEPTTELEGETTEPGKSKEQTITDLQEKVNSGEELTGTDKANWEYSTDKPLPVKEEASGIFDEKGDVSAAAVLDELNISSSYSEESIMQSVLDSAEYKLVVDKLNLKTMTSEAQAAATKDYLDTKFEGDKITLENNLTDRGLAFSGIRATQVRDLAASLTASKLDIDREMASKLMDLDLDFKEDVMNFISDKVTEAQAGEKDAIAQLNKAGLAVVGNKLMPTMEAQKEEHQQLIDNANLAIKNAQYELDIAQEQFNQAKTEVQLDQAQQKIDVSIKKYNLSVAKANGLGDNNVDSDVDKGKYSKEFIAATKAGTTALQKGEPWGTVWNRVKMQYPNMSNEDIDTSLGGGGEGNEAWGWAKPGAYEEWKGKQYKDDEDIKYLKDFLGED